MQSIIRLLRASDFDPPKQDGVCPCGDQVFPPILDEPPPPPPPEDPEDPEDPDRVHFQGLQAELARLEANRRLREQARRGNRSVILRFRVGFTWPPRREGAPGVVQNGHEGDAAAEGGVGSGGAQEGSVPLRVRVTLRRPREDAQRVVQNGHEGNADAEGDAVSGGAQEGSGTQAGAD